jgi:hypothetical protein
MTEKILEVPPNIESTAKLMTHTIMRLGYLQVQEYWAECAAARHAENASPAVVDVPAPVVVDASATVQTNVVQLRPKSA